MTDKNENTVFSPISLSTALSMLSNGAEKETLDEILKTLGNGKLTVDELNDYCRVITSRLNKTDNKVKLQLANSIWANSALPINNSFMGRLTEYFDAESYIMNSDPAQTTADINKWCNEKTDGMIKEILKEPTLSPLILINALCLNAP